MFPTRHWTALPLLAGALVSSPTVRAEMPYRWARPAQPPCADQAVPAALLQPLPLPILAAPLQDDGLTRQGIREVLDAQVAAWNRGDLEGFMQGYWKSEALVFFSGKDVTRGWAATLERYRKRYQANGREMGRLHFSNVELAILSADAAVVRDRWQLDLKGEEPGGLFTLLFKRLPEGWRIVHDHTSN